MTGMRAGEQAVVLQAASICLQYPDGTVRDRFPLVRGAVDGPPAGRPRERLVAFLQDAAGAPHTTGDHRASLLEAGHVVLHDFLRIRKRIGKLCP
jgi:nitrate reductase delta subunit